MAAAAPELKTKEFPTNYPEEAVTILRSMSFNDGKGLMLVGSASIRSQQYAGDYDGYQVVQMDAASEQEAAKQIARQWQENVKRLRAMSYVYVGDIKCGSIEQWRVIPATARLVDGKVVDYNPTQSKKALDALLRSKVISPAEAKEAEALLKSPDNVAAFLQAKQTIKFHVIRWTAAEILAGRKKLRDGQWMYLRQAVLLPGVAKMDVVALIQKARFTDFSVIYEFRHKDKVLNPETYDIRESLRESIVAYKTEGNYFKMLKRIFALARFENDLETVKELTPILNSDLGRLYHIVSDIRTLTELLERPRVPLPLIRYEIDQFVGRLSNIYTLTDYLKAEGDIIGRIHALTKMGKAKMAKAMEALGDQLEGYLQYATKHAMKIPDTPLSGGGPFTDQMKAALAELGYSSVEAAPSVIRDLFTAAKAELDAVGTTSVFASDTTGSKSRRKQEIVDRFIAALTQNPVAAHPASSRAARVGMIQRRGATGRGKVKGVL